MRRTDAADHTRLLSGTAMAQAVLYLGTPLILAVYSPAQFGDFSAIVALSMPLAILFNLRLDMAVALQDSDAGARRLVLTSLQVACLTALLATGALLPLAWAAAPGSLLSVLWVAPLLALVSAASQLLISLCVREGRFTSIAWRSVAQAVLTVGLQLAFGLAWSKAYGLLAGLAAATLVVTIALARTAGMLGEPRPSLRDSLGTIRSHRAFILTLTPAGLLNAASLWAPVLILVSAFGPREAGLYALAQRLLSVPVLVVGQSFGQVYLSATADLRRTGAPGMKRRFLRTSTLLAALASAGFVATVTGGPTLTSWVFGAEWDPAGTYLRALAIAFALQLVVSPISHTLVVLGRATSQLLWDVGRFSVTVGGMLIAVGAGWSAPDTVLGYSLLTAAAYLVLWVMCWARIRSVAT